MLPVGRPALGKVTMASDRSLHPEILSIVLLPVDGDDKDDTSGSLGLNVNASIGDQLFLGLLLNPLVKSISLNVNAH